ncbi:permease-like cell division protein FtsX [Nonomuraea sp. NPDC050663]|uniref:permease-like cell division protein FtsX n=1 Tax=Nonomuraea sp. NPDC050663 TaxID=3364370 RepID=UPI0037AC6796
MSIIEDRLRDALDGVGSSVAPLELRPLGETRRRLRFDVRYVAGAAAVLGMVVGAGVFMVRSPTPVEAGGRAFGVDVTVFLCTRGSADHACDGRSATPTQLEAIQHYLTLQPEVRSIVFEGQTQAFANLQGSEEGEQLAKVLGPADMTESFRLTLRAGVSSRALRDQVGGMPGVSRIVDHRCDPGAIPAEQCG